MVVCSECAKTLVNMVRCGSKKPRCKCAICKRTRWGCHWYRPIGPRFPETSASSNRDPGDLLTDEAFYAPNRVVIAENTDVPETAVVTATRTAKG